MRTTKNGKVTAPEFTRGDVIEEVRRIAGENPDYVYETPSDSGLCVYVDEAGGASCIFGRALTNLGASFTLDYEDGIDYLTLDLEGLPEGDVEHRLHDPALRWMRLVQHKQDVRTPWGVAVAYADTRFPEIAEAPEHSASGGGQG